MSTICANHKGIAFKSTTQWGVVLSSDTRLTGEAFGNFKSEKRQQSEADLIEYMCAPSVTRSDALETRRDFSIAVALAPPGTGKSRLLDDAMRVPLESPHFDHFLRFAITFNGESSGTYYYPISVRLLYQFFCTGVSDNVLDVLGAIDQILRVQFDGEGEAAVVRHVLNAVEALYFQQRGGKLGRTVLMVDEISKAAFSTLSSLPSDRQVHEITAYRAIAGIVDAAPLSHAYGRRGAVITALSYVETGSPIAGSGRNLLWLPLGKFDVWRPEAQEAIAAEATRLHDGGAPFRLLEPGDKVHESVWSLLASTGGRPRDILRILAFLRKRGATLVDPLESDLQAAFYTGTRSLAFPAYLLPSMLSVPFSLFSKTSTGETVLSTFGVNASDAALLNVDDLAGSDVAAAVPAVALQFAPSLSVPSRTAVRALVDATTFSALNGSGKDFEHVWVLLVFTHLLLQFNVRVGADAMLFWPHNVSGRDHGGPERPTATEIEVFQRRGVSRINSLFAMPVRNRIHSAPLIQRKIMFAPVEPPTLAIWDDLWVANVVAGARPKGWAMATLDVVWRPSTVVYFSKATHIAIDFMLLVGDERGTGDARPHVYMFQCKALAAPVTQGSATTKSVTVESIVRGLDVQLDPLFTPDFDGHVLRRAGTSVLRRLAWFRIHKHPPKPHKG
jgi:hypothetical protein